MSDQLDDSCFSRGMGFAGHLSGAVRALGVSRDVRVLLALMFQLLDVLEQYVTLIKRSFALDVFNGRYETEWVDSEKVFALVIWLRVSAQPQDLQIDTEGAE